ncbi:MipA/OmpV family protein [Sphingomonas silueang]|uniref:MipA/OmpV family protein n=1 Tax=Sphingomonas silueang TaxID=3156617 RepID=UPI0032B3E2A7
MRVMTAMLLGGFIAGPAWAQDAPPRGTGRPAAPEGWSVTIGAAPVLSPAWQGSRDMALSIFPDLRVNYGDVLFASVPDGIGWNAVNADGWRAGPLVKIRFGRDERDGGSPFLIAGGSDALEGMGNIRAAGEAGGFVEKTLGPWRLRGEVRQGFGGHRGLVGDASAAWRVRQGRTAFSIGPRLTAASGNFQRTYFGIDAGQSARTGLARYAPGGGLVSYGVGGSVVRPIDRRQAVTLFTGLDRLAGPAGDSPLVRERGRRTQFTLGIGYGFRFGL